ncbi:MAG: O-antigen ligase family protein [Burkholderiales bacterium]|nr:O-antigen ligase family protein [Phycisphaerae bacterium]
MTNQLNRFQSLAWPTSLVLLCSILGLASTYIGLEQPLIGVGIAYIAAFMTMAWYRPDIALMLCFASAPLQNDLTGTDAESHGKFSISEIHLALTFGVFILRQIQVRKLVTLGPLTIPIAIHFAVCLFASVQSFRSNTIISMAQMGLYMVMTTMLFASLPRLGETFRGAFYALMVVGVFLALVSLTTSETYILGLHKNGVGASIATALVVSIDMWMTSKGRKYRWVSLLAMVILAAGLLHTLSRGAWIFTLVALLTISYVRRDFKLMFRLALLLGPVVTIGWFALPQESRDYALGFNTERANINARYLSMRYALDQFYRNPVYGVGVGLRKDYDATNIAFATLAETGVVGLATFTMIHVVFVLAMVKVQRHLTPKSPVYALPALGAGLLMGKFMNGMVDHYWSRGALMMVWAAAGMGLSAYWYVRHQRNLMQRAI